MLLICCFASYSRGADPNSVDAKQRSALHYCVFKNNPEMVKFLVGLQDINLNLVNSFGETPLDLCKSIPESKEVEQILRAAGKRVISLLLFADLFSVRSQVGLVDCEEGRGGCGRGRLHLGGAAGPTGFRAQGAGKEQSAGSVDRPLRQECPVVGCR